MTNTAHNLEDQLRAHYAAKAGELRLPDVTLDDVLARGDVPVTATATGSPRRGWIAGSVAAALVAGAVIGAGVVLVARGDDPAPASGPTVLPQTQPLAGPSASGGRFMPCPEERVPDDVASMELPNDLRAPNVLLPETPDGFCIVDHHVSSTVGLPGTAEAVVWATCLCDRPEASFALMRLSDDNNPDDPMSEFVDVEVNGRPARLYVPDGQFPLTRLYTTDHDGTPVALVGWGFDEDDAVAYASTLTSRDEEPTIEGFEVTYEGWLSGGWPWSVSFDSTLSIGYSNAAGDATISFAAWDYIDQRPLAAYTWARPNAELTTIDGRRAITFSASASYADTEQTVVIVQIDENTTVMWTSNGAPPMDADALAAIPLTPAPVDDPRWLELAYESGQYDAQG